MTELAREMQRAERTSQALTLVYVDIDGMKAINDSKGHAAGDDALVGVVQAIKDKMRAYDLVVRMGGDEFICVLGGVDEAGAESRVRAVTDALGAHPDLPSATFGVAAMIAGESPNDLIKRADMALYDRRKQRRSDRDLP